MNQFKLLSDIARFNMMKGLAYPWELSAFFLRKFIYLLFLSFFWLAVSRSTEGALNFRQLIAYFLLSSAVTNLIFSNSTPFGRYIYRKIRNGELSNFLIKPISTVPFLFFSFIGENWMNIFYALISATIAIIMIPPPGILNVVFFLVFIVLAFFVSFALNILIATLSFYFVEVAGIRNSFDHVRTIQSGSLIPLTMFPIMIKQVVMFTPFPLLAFIPTYTLQNPIQMWETLQMISISVAWASGLTVIMSVVWRKSLKKYEGVGI